MEYLILALIGFVMGTVGGLLGVGGSIIMIPALVLIRGENQHLYQAAAMMCNFFVATSAVLVHRKNNMLMGSVLKFLIPAAIAGVIIGVSISNLPFFAGEKSAVLARIFGGFMVYVAAYNCLKLFKITDENKTPSTSQIKRSIPMTYLVGLVTGIGAGMLGLGGGSICVPLQQLFLKIPLKKAISNSAATIILIAVFGSTMKNLTLSTHGIAITESLKIAVFVIPTAFIGGYCGGHFLHKLPKTIVRVIFIIMMILASYKMLTV